jgi:hypothetical protein
MTIEERRQYIYDKAYAELENDNEAFCEACEELDNWDGFLGDDRCHYMSEIDELLYGKKPSEVINMITGDFNSNDDFFYFSIYGLESCDDRWSHYSDVCSVDDVLDKLIEEYNHVSLTENSALDSLVELLFNEDFGIEDEEDPDSEDNVSDEEFKQEVDAL